MTESQTNRAQQRFDHQLAYWDQLRQVQPFDEDGAAEVFPLAGTGTVYSFTTVLAPAAEFADYAPYALALVQLDEGPLVTAQLTDLDEPPQIGMRVEMVVRKVRTDGQKGIIIYGPKFRPLLVED